MYKRQPRADADAAARELGKFRNMLRERVRSALASAPSPDAPLPREAYARWGFKAPVTMYLIPLWDELFPGCVFVHVVRDGRDIAFHWLQSPVRRYWRALFRSEKTSAELAKPDGGGSHALIPDAGYYIGKAYLYLPKGNTAPHLRIAELWARANAGAADAGRALLGARYVAVRSEDTAHDEDAFLRAGAAVASALDPGRAPEERYALCCMLRNHFAASSAAPGWRKAMESYGKWRGAVASAELGGERGAFARELVGRMRPALERFGYLGERDGIGALNLSAAAGALHRECAATVVDARCREFQPNKQKCIG